MSKLKRRLGKYRIIRRLAEGGFASVYKAYDTIAGVDVALKIPHPNLLTKETLDDFRREVRVTARLDHPNILPVKDAGFIDGTFVIACPLGQQTLADRLTRRISPKTVADIAGQILEALAFAHGQRVMHCDVKPENVILFPGPRVRLADFGLAKVAQRTIRASGSGTVGYIAPEQAMGKPSFRSDVFSAGLMIYRMLSGALPEWPFPWPPPGYDRLRRTVPAPVVEFLKKSMAVDHRKRYADARQMLAAFQRLRPRWLRAVTAGRRGKQAKAPSRDWRLIRRVDFLRRYRKILEIRGVCSRCQGPVAETMCACPWCGTRRHVQPREHRFRTSCPRCRRSLKTDWRFCPWCFGPAVNPDSRFRFSDFRYARRCPAAHCEGKWLMPFMRYCPWCRRKVRIKWRLEGSKARCPRCQWGVLPDYWDFCPWCGKTLGRHQVRP